MKSLSVMFAVLVCVQLFGADVESRHSTGGALGVNGVKEHAQVKIYKAASGKVSKDKAFVQIDLGDHKYDSVKSEALIKDRPIIFLNMGVLRFEGLANEKGKIISPNFTAKLIKKGAGMRFTIKKQDLSILLSSLVPVEGHADLTITIQDNHAPAPVAPAEVESRHANSVYTRAFGLKIQETEKVLNGKG